MYVYVYFGMCVYVINHVSFIFKYSNTGLFMKSSFSLDVPNAQPFYIKLEIIINNFRQIIIIIFNILPLYITNLNDCNLITSSGFMMTSTTRRYCLPQGTVNFNKNID